MTEALESAIYLALVRLNAKYPEVTGANYGLHGDIILLGINKHGSYTQTLLPVHKFADKETAWETVETFTTMYCHA